jgi:hypothetical protein
MLSTKGTVFIFFKSQIPLYVSDVNTINCKDSKHSALAQSCCVVLFCQCSYCLFIYFCRDGETPTEPASPISPSRLPHSHSVIVNGDLFELSVSSSPQTQGEGNTVSEDEVHNPELAKIYVARRNPPDCAPFNIGAMSFQCQYCQAFRFYKEKLNCCHQGKIVLPPLTEYPDELKHYFINGDPIATNFRTNIRQYNSALAFASFGANIKSPPGRGPYCFRIHGQIYHQVGSLNPVCTYISSWCMSGCMYKRIDNSLRAL